MNNRGIFIKWREFCHGEGGVAGVACNDVIVSQGCCRSGNLIA
jgi:hypothetical protein